MNKSRLDRRHRHSAEMKARAVGSLGLDWLMTQHRAGNREDRADHVRDQLKSKPVCAHTEATRQDRGVSP